MSDTNGKVIDRAELAKALDEEGIARAKRVMDKIQDLLKEEDCVIKVEPFIDQGAITARWGVFARR